MGAYRECDWASNCCNSLRVTAACACMRLCSQLQVVARNKLQHALKGPRTTASCYVRGGQKWPYFRGETSGPWPYRGPCNMLSRTTERGRSFGTNIC